MADDATNQNEQAQPATPADGATGRDRRRHPRVAVQGQVPTTLRRAAGETIEVSMRDLSRSGVGLFAPVPMEPGERVELVCESPGRPVLRAMCRVAACRTDEEGRHMVGLEFVEIARTGAPRTSSPPQAGPAAA